MDSNWIAKAENLILGMNKGDIIDITAKIKPENRWWFVEIAKILFNHGGRELCFNDNYTKLKRVK